MAKSLYQSPDGAKVLQVYDPANDSDMESIIEYQSPDGAKVLQVLDTAKSKSLLHEYQSPDGAKVLQD